jgi:hypothetical protein
MLAVPWSLPFRRGRDPRILLPGRKERRALHTKRPGGAADCERSSCLDWPDVCAQPNCQLLLRHRAICNRQHHPHRFSIAGGQPISVQGQEHAGRNNQGRSLVSIKKCMVACNAEDIGGRKIGYVGISICSKMSRTGKCRKQQGFVPEPSQTAMFRNLFVMSSQDYILGYPAPPPIAHLASSRSTSRRSRMNLRAMDICSSNSGS